MHLKLNYYFNMSLFRAAFVNKLANPEAYIQANLNNENLTKSSATETGWILQATLLRNHPKLSGNYSRDLKSYHLKYGNIWNPDFLKVGFQMVPM